jgi:hypothetical protein
VDVGEVLHHPKLRSLGRPPHPSRPSHAHLEAVGILETTAIGNGHHMLLEILLPPTISRDLPE